MPACTFVCPKCTLIDTYFLDADDWDMTLSCVHCYPRVIMKRLFRTPPSLSVNEVIDNGNSARSVEQPSDIHELLQDREEDNRDTRFKDDL